MAQETNRFQRWQKIAIDQLTYALNLFSTLTIATLGYWFSLLKDQNFQPGSTGKCMMLFSFLALAVSGICGLICVVNRLSDFRGTAKRAKGQDDAPTRDELRGLGQITWVLFYAHLVSFTVGIGLLAVTLLLTYGNKLR